MLANLNCFVLYQALKKLHRVCSEIFLIYDNNFINLQAADQSSTFTTTFKHNTNTNNNIALKIDGSILIGFLDLCVKLDSSSMLSIYLDRKMKIEFYFFIFRCLENVFYVPCILETKTRIDFNQSCLLIQVNHKYFRE